MRKISRPFYWAYDGTSISSRSELLKQVRYGKNKDGGHLPQINLTLIFGEKSHLPFYYRKLAGNIPDVKTIQELLRELDVLGCGKIKLVMDRGYYSVDNINALLKKHLKFLRGTTSSRSFAKEFIREIGNKKDHYEYYNSDLELYVFSKTIAWDYEQPAVCSAVLNQSREKCICLCGRYSGADCKPSYLRNTGYTGKENAPQLGKMMATKNALAFSCNRAGKPV